jgi:DNA modification methylase
MSNEDAYITEETKGNGWEMWLGDSGERIAQMPDECVDLSIDSPPFQSLYTYSPNPRDMGNSLDRDDFFEQYSYIIRENYRIQKPGTERIVHVQQTTTTMTIHGVIGLTDFRGDVIRAFQKEGWIYFGENVVDKDPQAQAIRTKAHSLMFVTKNRDSSLSRMALADYGLIFKKPGERDVPVKTDVTNEEWIEFARPIWYGISEGDTLNARIAREAEDERHLTPLQLGFTERYVRLYTNPGELVFSAFAGVGSEGYVAVKNGRRFHGIELKPSYYNTACRYLTELTEEMAQPQFDLA